MDFFMVERRVGSKLNKNIFTLICKCIDNIKAMILLFYFYLAWACLVNLVISQDFKINTEIINSFVHDADIDISGKLFNPQAVF